MCNHFLYIGSGYSLQKEYKAPNLLITGPPGCGKSWLVRCIDELAALMDLGKPIKTTFMGIAAINIGGYTMNSFLDVPLETNQGTGNSRKFKPWDPDRLQQFKQMYDITTTSAIIIDEISMVKPWMLAYIDDRLKEATQVFDKPFGGLAVLMFGDFDQQAPIGGSSLPHLSISLLEQEYQRKHKIFYTKQSRMEKVEMNSTLSRKGVQLFKSADHLKLSTQHRCIDDQAHMAIIDKMNSGNAITPEDLELYKTFTEEDMKDLDNFLFSTIIVTGNYERHEFNAFMAHLWALHFNTHVIRWKKKVRDDKWKGKPRCDEALREAEQQSCFYELFVPAGPGYISHNINLCNDLANGTEIREHSPAFDDAEEKIYLEHMLATTPVGEVIDLPEPPTAINVEIYPDFPDDTMEEREEKRKK
jgi:hypothetical protein